MYCYDSVSSLLSHRFPKNSEELGLWLKNFQKDFVPTSYTRLCSDHFSEDSLDKTVTGHALKPGAVPTIFETVRCIFCNASKILHPHLTFHK
ncbi:THAP domain-containing protein 4 [Cyphomyrmex costatus]|uniref:THAP domain-containing protein 4 n=1 Tax=Cyphomyrmex costatus TaxID=456900 RepID=A0A151IJE5_9HYME|nr:THAP domain-containing protein 4 [Cyphomyrmex costatus]KYN04631.1 THAP domain-containing protein 4 [Cyphomyrmex costatus]KYN04945.1 THAP domain-containing protein 4 [Cyphomyrmex costatus]